MTTTSIRTCPLCEATCGLELTIEGGSVKVIRGDQNDVFSHGFICPKGTTLGRLHEDPDRLRKPLIKEDGEFVEVSWDEAIAAAGAGIRRIIDEHGAPAVATYVGNPNVHNLAGSLYLRPLLKALGSPNVFSASTVDQMPKHVSSGAMFGNPDLIPVPDIDRTDYLLMLGADPYESNGSLATAPDWPGRMKGIQDRGGKIVTIDPRRSKTAKASDEHVFIRPGTDAAWLAALVTTVLEDGGPDLPDFMSGLAEATEALAPFTPESVAATTGIPADVTRRIAIEFSNAPTAVAYGRIGTHTTEFGTLASWLADLLNAVTGNLDSPGGAMFPLPAIVTPKAQIGGRGFQTGRFRSRVGDYPEVRGEMPSAALVDEIETPGEGQVRALLIVAGNPARSIPDSERVEAALDRLEFMVAVDVYLTETARHADVVLPPPSVLERAHFDVAFTSLMVRNTVNYSPPAFEKPEDHPAEWEILLGLAAAIQATDLPVEQMDEAGAAALLAKSLTNPASPAFGADQVIAWDQVCRFTGPQRILDIRLRTGPYGDGFGSNPDGLSLQRLIDNPHGIDLGPLEPRLPVASNNPDGLVHLAPPQFLADLPRLATNLEAPPGTFVMVGRRQLRSNNSWMHNIEVLVKGKDRCTLLMHPADAESLGVEAGEAVSVTSDAGEVRAPVELSDDMMPGVVSLPHGWGHDDPEARLTVAARRPGVNSNVLSNRTAIDPLSGNARLNGIPVDLARVS
jgi:anaerobic selenocysteine-containing dehydrogenase